MKVNLIEFIHYRDLPQDGKKEEGKIIYTHDEADDFDEEDDPDNDLIF